MTTAPKEKKSLQFFNLPWPVFLIITVVTILATYLGVLPVGMTGNGTRSHPCGDGFSAEPGDLAGGKFIDAGNVVETAFGKFQIFRFIVQHRRPRQQGRDGQIGDRAVPPRLTEDIVEMIFPCGLLHETVRRAPQVSGNAFHQSPVFLFDPA